MIRIMGSLSKPVRTSLLIDYLCYRMLHALPPLTACTLGGFRGDCDLIESVASSPCTGQSRWRYGASGVQQGDQARAA